ncbi:MAG: N-acetylmuramoyl-L-alanine amidase [Desulfobulbaceae bacterium]|jgi:N-acetylmuramoyl-L-alanine amidase|nr:N-acetylmuramoyl-L-alanine amidase [Desulfobulbaceae bacterium]
MTCRSAFSGCFAFLPPLVLILLIFFPPLTAFAEGGDEGHTPAKDEVESRYDQGKFYFNQLQNNSSLAANRDNWLKCINIFENIYRENPSHNLAPASLYMICRARLQMFDRFQKNSDLDEAIVQLQNLVKVFPNSTLADDALFALGKLYLDNKNDRQQAVRYFSRVINEYPNGDMYTLAAQTLRQLSQQFGITLPDAMLGSAPEKLNTIFPAKFWSSPQYGRIVVGASGPVTYKAGILEKKSGVSRLYIDFTDSYTAPTDRGRVTATDNALLHAITTEQKTGDSVRIVVEAADMEDYQIYSLPDPFRVIVDVRGKEKKADSLSKSVPKPPPARIDEALVKHEATAPAATQTPASSPASKQRSVTVMEKGKKKAETTATERPAVATTPPPTPSTPTRPSMEAVTIPPATPLPTPLSAPTPAETVTTLPATPLPTPPSTPPPTEATTTAPQEAPSIAATAPPMPKRPSLAQQLSLGVKKIVLDPGHGGKDPGAMAGSLQEKDVVLAVAKRLKPVLEKELGCQVVLTREGDRFLGLEERTAFANTEGADLFLSLHLNAHSSSQAHGFETYYLNLTTNPEAMRVAAQENATSTHQLSDLQDILSNIMKNSKIAESSRLARLVNDAVAHGASAAEGDKMKKHGVKQAPFYVLIGAQMPAILLEMAFISNPDDAKHITSDDYVADMAKHIAQGILSYTNTNTARLKR